jgi:hypothetical protein
MNAVESALRQMAEALRRLGKGWALEDLRGLFAVASPGDLPAARELLQLISSRGFNRGKDLVAELDRASRELA